MPNLVLKQKSARGQTFVLSGPTHFGRYKDIRWAREERPIPEEFGQLEVAIMVEDVGVSRNHAAIVPKGGDFYIIDLNSKNGTFVNGKAQPNRKLCVGDKIRIGRSLEFVVCGDEKELDYCALLVGCRGKDLEGVKNDLDQFCEQLEKRGFAGNIEKLCGKQATRIEVLSELERISYLTTPKSHFVFFYSGHGDSKGIGLEDGILFPNDLYTKLENIRGRKAVILDCCGAGTFIDSGIPPNTLVLAASSKSGEAYERFTKLVGGNRMGEFTKVLVKYLSKNPERLNLKDFEKELRNLSNFDFYYQGPDVTGKSFTILTTEI